VAPLAGLTTAGVLGEAQLGVVHTHWLAWL
jgi:hypothetical protein